VNAPGPIGVVAHYNLLERLEPSGPAISIAHATRKLGAPSPCGCCRRLHDRRESRAALVAQARAMTVLSHPNVTTLFDAGEHDGRVYLAFEFLKGSRCAPRWPAVRSRCRAPSRLPSRSPMPLPTRTPTASCTAG
jgi:serine/threonine protein kinase